MYDEYLFCGFRFSVPAGTHIDSVAYWEYGFIIKTKTGDLTLKACRKCKRMVPLNAFYDGRSPCKQCHIYLVKQWRKRNPEHVKAMRRAYDKRRKAKVEK